MAPIFSRRLVEHMAGFKDFEVSGTGLALIDGGAGDDQVTDSGNGLGDFEVGHWLEIPDAQAAGNQIMAPILGVTAGALNLPTGTFASAQAAGNTLTLRSRYPKASFAQAFFKSQLDIYTSTIPDTPDDAENGTLLISFMNLIFGAHQWDATNLRAFVDLIQAVTATAVNTGDAGWFRLRGGGVYDTGASSGDLIRLDGTVGTTSSADLRVRSLRFEAGLSETLGSVKLYQLSFNTGS